MYLNDHHDHHDHHDHNQNSVMKKISCQLRSDYQEVFEADLLPPFEKTSADEMVMENVHEFIIDHKFTSICPVSVSESP
jgi:NADPH-dependent 7-cyano-7-deazaguanine reductase QueF